MPQGHARPVPDPEGELYDEMLRREWLKRERAETAEVSRPPGSVGHPELLESLIPVWGLARSDSTDTLADQVRGRAVGGAESPNFRVIVWSDWRRSGQRAPVDSLNLDGVSLYALMAAHVDSPEMWRRSGASAAPDRTTIRSYLVKLSFDPEADSPAVVASIGERQAYLASFVLQVDRTLYASATRSDAVFGDSPKNSPFALGVFRSRATRWTCGPIDRHVAIDGDHRS